MKVNSTFKLINSLVVLLFFLSSCNENRDVKNSTTETVRNKFTDAPGCYILESNSNEIKIPFEMYAGNKPMIIGESDGKKVKFLIDNGKLFNEVWFYNGEVDSIGLHYKSEVADSLIGIGKNDASLIFDGNPIKVGFEQIQFHNQPTLISSPDAGYADFFPGINGQVSSMLFKHFIVTFDFESNCIILIDPDKFKKSEKQNAIKMQKRDNGSYCVQFELLTKTENIYKILLDIDLGTVFSLYLISNDNNNLQISLNAKKQLIGFGGSGEIYGYNDTLKELRFGNYIFKNYPTLIVKEESNADKNIVESGTFGIELMKQFNITFDYFNEILYFEPNKYFEGTELKNNK